MALETDEFIRCFLLHLLPDCFQRIRYYGFLAIRYREQKLSVGRDGNKLWSLTLQGWTGDPLLQHCRVPAQRSRLPDVDR
jgi:hypothetical protein